VAKTAGDPADPDRTDAGIDQEKTNLKFLMPIPNTLTSFKKPI
jgi:hypothetical protein